MTCRDGRYRTVVEDTCVWEMVLRSSPKVPYGWMWPQTSGLEALRSVASSLTNTTSAMMERCDGNMRRPSDRSLTRRTVQHGWLRNKPGDIPPAKFEMVSPVPG